MKEAEENRAVPIYKRRTKTMVQTALLAALACLATMVFRLPSPTGGYLNLGDAVVLLGAYLMGPLYGAVAAGIGSMLADGLSGYVAYMPGTLVIKAAMALIAALLYWKLKRSRIGVFLCGIVGESLMVFGYWLYDALLLKSFAGSTAGIPSNLMQAVFGVAASTLLLAALRKNKYVRQEFPFLQSS